MAGGLLVQTKADGPMTAFHQRSKPYPVARTSQVHYPFSHSRIMSSESERDAEFSGSIVLPVMIIYSIIINGRGRYLVSIRGCDHYPDRESFACVWQLSIFLVIIQVDSRFPIELIYQLSCRQQSLPPVTDFFRLLLLPPPPSSRLRQTKPWQSLPTPNPGDPSWKSPSPRLERFEDPTTFSCRRSKTENPGVGRSSFGAFKHFHRIMNSVMNVIRYPLP